MYKKAFISIVCIAVLLSFAGCGAEKASADITGLVENHYDEIVAACENKDTQALLAIDGISQVRVVDGYVLVYCQGAGIATSSQDYGFYYTEENIPVGVGCTLEIVCNIDTMQPEGKGYRGVVHNNDFYTEQIRDNIYFYSNAY